VRPRRLSCGDGVARTEVFSRLRKLICTGCAESRLPGPTHPPAAGNGVAPFPQRTPVRPAYMGRQDPAGPRCARRRLRLGGSSKDSSTIGEFLCPGGRAMVVQADQAGGAEAVGVLGAEAGDGGEPHECGEEDCGWGVRFLG